MELEPLEDVGLLWEVIHPVLIRYNPSNDCIATLCMNIYSQLHVEAGISREDFLDRTSQAYDLHVEKWEQKKNAMD